MLIYILLMQLSAEETGRLRLVLQRISFLEKLKMSELDQLISALNKRSYKRGETLIKQGSRGDVFFIMASGRVGVYREKFFSRKQIATLGPEAFFGEMSLIDNLPRNATVVAEEDSDVYYVSHEDFQSILLKNPGIAAVIKQTADFRRIQNRSSN